MLQQSRQTQNYDHFYQPSEQVPQTGIYELMHESGGTGTVVLVRNKSFPICPDCGSRVRYRLLKAAPHIREDQDFR